MNTRKRNLFVLADRPHQRPSQRNSAARALCSSLVGCALLFVTFGQATAEGWLQPHRACYAKLYDRMLIGSRAYAADGLHAFADVTRYQDHLINVYAECGISDRLTVTLSMAPIGFAKVDTSTLYVGPLIFGARYGIKRQGALRLAVSAGFGIDPAVGNVVIGRTRYRRESDGSEREAIYKPTIDNVLVQLLFEMGYSFELGSLPSFASAAVGARINGASGVDHALLASAQWGVLFFSRRFVVDLHVNLYEPFFQPVVVTNISGAGQTRYLGVGFTFSVWLLDQLALFATIDGVAYAESNAATPSLGFGLETRFSL